jgi:hypothetical protein
VVQLVLEAPARLEALLEDQPAVPPALEVLERLVDLQALEDQLVVPLELKDQALLGVPLVRLVTSKEKIVSMEPLVLALEPLGRLEAPQALEDLAALEEKLVPPANLEYPEMLMALPVLEDPQAARLGSAVLVASEDPEVLLAKSEVLAVSVAPLA